MAKERALVVGAGGISPAWFAALKREKVAVCGIVDLDVKRARRMATRFELDCMLTDDLAAALRDAKPDFVVDVTVPEAHCEVTCTALKAGCPVVGEKPMASSMSEARKMVRTAEKTGQLYMVSQSRRWDAMHETVRRELAKQRIGELTTVNCDFYIGARFDGFRTRMASPLILDMAIHHFDLIRFMTGKDAVAVYTHEFNPKGSWYEGDCAATCIFEMDDGVVFTYRGSWCAEGCHTSWNGDWRFAGTKGTLLYEQDRLATGEVVVGRKGFFRKTKPFKTRRAGMPRAQMRGGLGEMLRFLRTGERPQTECHDNIKSLAMVFAALESSKKGRRVKC